MRPNGRRPSTFLAACTAWFRLIIPPKGSQTLSPFTTPQSAAWMWWTRWCGSTLSAQGHGAGHMCAKKAGKEQLLWTQPSTPSPGKRAMCQVKHQCKNNHATVQCVHCYRYTCGKCRREIPWQCQDCEWLLECTHSLFNIICKYVYKWLVSLFYFVLFLSINLSNKGKKNMWVDFSLRWQSETQVSLKWISMAPHCLHNKSNCSQLIKDISLKPSSPPAVLRVL